MSKTSNKLKNICDSVSNNITEKEFDNLYIKINGCIYESYNSDDEDIEDLGDIVIILNEFIKKMWTNKNNLIKFIELIGLKLKAKKLNHSKLREGYDFYYSEQIKNGEKKSLIKYVEEKPRNYFNVYECEYQYKNFLNNVWEPSVKETEELYYSLRD